MDILGIVPIAAAIAFVAWLEWPVKEHQRCRVCGYLSKVEVCSQACQARVDMKVISTGARELHEMNYDEFGF